MIKYTGGDFREDMDKATPIIVESYEGSDGNMLGVRIMPQFLCKKEDVFLSIQAGPINYCVPRTLTSFVDYLAVELAFMSYSEKRNDVDFMSSSEIKSLFTFNASLYEELEVHKRGQIFAFVPYQLVQKVVEYLC